MKKSAPKNSSPKEHFGIIRSSLVAIRILHKNLGAPRIIIAYVFFAFALLSLSFTIRIPVSSHFLTPSGWAKAQSRVITAFIMIVNLFVYGMIMNWRKGRAFYIAVRVVLISLALYFDVFLVRVIYILIRDGSFF